jgi:internalin A
MRCSFAIAAAFVVSLFVLAPQAAAQPGLAAARAESAGQRDSKGAGNEVIIPDLGLETALRNALSKPTGPLLDTELETLLSLNAFNDNITNLSGLEFCRKLRELDLGSNSISDLSPLVDLSSLT